MTTKPKVSPEYLSNLKDRYNAWNRGNETVNLLVWNDLDVIIAKAREKAYAEEHYEAFACLCKLEEVIKGHATVLKYELQIVSG